MNRDFCFCTLALGGKYRSFAKQLAEDLEKHSPGTSLVIYTEEPEYFSSQSNVLAFQHRQQSILLCYHDKRFVIEKALSMFRIAIFIDADMRIVRSVPDYINWGAGVTAGHQENLIEHVKAYTPERLKHIKKLALKLNIELESAKYIGESLFIVGRDEGREREFIKQWGIIASYLQLKGDHAGEGNAMGLAAAKVGWTIKRDGWQDLRQVCHHLSGHSTNTQPTFWENLKRRLAYHYRLNRARLMALNNFVFYYR